MNIALPKETKVGEKRIALVPEHVKKLIDAGHRVLIEKDAGIGAGFSDQEYARVGAQIVSAEEIYQQPLIVRVKEPPLETLRSNQTIMSYLHIEKNQNPVLLQALLDHNITAYAFEEIRDPQTKHNLISQGFEAGVVGMFEGLRYYGEILEKNNQPNPFKNIKTMQDYLTKKEAYLALREINPRDIKMNVCLAGYGKVSKGCQEVLAQLSNPPLVLREEDTARTKIWGKDFAYIWKHLPTIDIFVNAVFWKPGQQRVLTKQDLELMKKDGLIIDISCDQAGGIETCTPTDWQNPTYQIQTDNHKTITHFCVDNLPSAMANEASLNISRMTYSSILKVANGEELTYGLMTKEGQFVFESPFSSN